MQYKIHRFDPILYNVAPEESEGDNTGAIHVAPLR